MPNRRYNKQVPGFMKGGRVKKMNGGSANGKPVSKSKNPGLAKMAKTPKGKAAVKKMGFNPNRMVAKKGGLSKLNPGLRAHMKKKMKGKKK